MDCALCSRVELIKRGEYPFLIHEFENSYLMLGEHQYYQGYCVLLSKSHHVEMSDIPSPIREKLFTEMMISSDLIKRVFAPKKMNLCSLGNVVEHLHWHFFPRYAEDQNFKNPPWLQMHLFDSAKTTPEMRDVLIKKLQLEIQKL